MFLYLFSRSQFKKDGFRMIDAKAAICVQLRAEAHWDQFIRLGPSWDQNPQFCGRIQLV